MSDIEIELEDNVQFDVPIIHNQLPQQLSLRAQMFWVSLPFKWKPSLKFAPCFWFLFFGVGLLATICKRHREIKYALKWVLFITVLTALGVLSVQLYSSRMESKAERESLTNWETVTKGIRQ